MIELQVFKMSWSEIQGTKGRAFKSNPKIVSQA